MSTKFKLKKGITTQEKAVQHLKEIVASLKRYKLTSKLVVSFPTRRKTPFFSKIALWIVVKQKGLLDIEYKERK